MGARAAAPQGARQEGQAPGEEVRDLRDLLGVLGAGGAQRRPTRMSTIRAITRTPPTAPRVVGTQASTRAAFAVKPAPTMQAPAVIAIETRRAALRIVSSSRS